MCQVVFTCGRGRFVLCLQKTLIKSLLCMWPVRGWARLDRTRLDWAGPGWTRLDWAGLDWAGPGWTRLDRARPDWAGLGWTGLDRTGLDRAGLDRTGLDWAGLDWAGPGWTGLDRAGLGQAWPAGRPKSPVTVSVCMSAVPSGPFLVLHHQSTAEHSEK